MRYPKSNTLSPLKKIVIRSFNRCVKALNDFAEGWARFWVNHTLISKHSTGDQYHFVLCILRQSRLQYKSKSGANHVFNFLAWHQYSAALIAPKLQNSTILCLIKEQSVADLHIVYICLKTIEGRRLKHKF